VKLRLSETDGPAEAAVADSAVRLVDVEERVRRFAVLRAAQRAFNSSSAEPLDETELGVMGAIRERIASLKEEVERIEAAGEGGPGSEALAGFREEIDSIDGALDGYRRSLLAWVERLPIAQLRAALSNETHPERVEASALLEVCLDAEPVPTRYLRVVDFLITLLSAGQRDGRWVVELDPANLNDGVRARCEQAGDVDTRVEARITSRFQTAAERLASVDDGSAVLQEMTAYKVAVAGFYFAPSVLRCIVGYNVAARNHIAERVRRGREQDAEVENALGSFGLLQSADPRLGAADGPGLPAHEAPGVLAVQAAIRRRLLEIEGATGPAERIAADLDLDWLERDERQALEDPTLEGVHRVIRMTVVLGHLAMSLPAHARDVEALGIAVPQLDQWICALGDEVQQEIDTLIRGNEYDGAVRLGDTKGRFLAAVQVVARRRLGRSGRARAPDDSFEHDAIALLREYLEREKLNRRPPLFNDLFGGGWRRSVALATLCVLLAWLVVPQLLPDGHPRAIDTMQRWEARDISTLLASAYRDRADEHSIFIGTVRSDRWKQLTPEKRHLHAALIRDRVRERGVEEVLLFDEDRVLQAHYAGGAWKTTRAWQGG